MKPFDNVQSVAASINENDLDTDIIFPARFLLLLDKKGLGEHAFHERRAARDTAPFILDLPPFDKAEILVAARNFGTGSSREQAVWALADFGIRVAIAESFGEIFYANCFKNGVLPIAVDKEDIMRIRASAEAGEILTVDLLTQSITLTSGPVISFDIPPHRKEALLRGTR
ncbi:3-isopropylmalate dehydratase small subunit [Ochrobactrum teleogrylli]